MYVVKLEVETRNEDTLGLQETFIGALLLDPSRKIKGAVQFSIEGIMDTLVDLLLLFAIVLNTLSTGINFVQYHPLGTLNPNGPDKDLTKQIQKADVLFDIKVLDLLIIVRNSGFFSLAEQVIH